MAPPPTLATAPLAQVAAALRRRTVSPLELLEAYQQRIGPAAELRAFITPPGERARREAQRAQQQLARRQAGALLGVPIAVQGLVETRGLRTAAGHGGVRPRGCGRWAGADRRAGRRPTPGRWRGRSQLRASSSMRGHGGEPGRRRRG